MPFISEIGYGLNNKKPLNKYYRMSFIKMKNLPIYVLVALSIATSASANEYYLEQSETLGNYNSQLNSLNVFRESTTEIDTISNKKVASHINVGEYLNLINTQRYFLVDTCSKFSHRSSNIKQVCYDSSEKLSKLHSVFSKDNLSQEEFDILKNKYSKLEVDISETIIEEISAL